MSLLYIARTDAKNGSSPHNNNNHNSRVYLKGTIICAALAAAYRRKMTHQAGEAVRREGMVFVPMPWETLGGWHEQTIAQVKKLASAQARQTGDDRSDTIRQLYQK